MPQVPFVFVTGTLNDEEKVAQAVLRGASGYILKDNLKEIEERLNPIIQQSLQSIEDNRTAADQKAKRERLEQKLEAKIHALPNSEHKKELVGIVEEMNQLK